MINCNTIEKLTSDTIGEIDQQDFNSSYLFKRQAELIKKLSSTFLSVDIDQVINMLKYASYDVREDLQRQIRDEHPDDTEYPINKVFAIIEAMDILHSVNSELDNFHRIEETYQAE
jgi:hypothetical protein